MLSKKDKRMLFGKSMSLTALALLIILCIIVCSIISLGWFADNYRTRANGLGIDTMSDYFELAVSGEQVLPFADDAPIVTYLSAEQNGDFNKLASTDINNKSILCRVINENPHISGSDELAPGAFGKISFDIVIPAGSALRNFEISLRYLPFDMSAGVPQAVSNEDINQLREVLSGHILLFSSRSALINGGYYYSDRIVDNSFIFRPSEHTPTVGADGDHYTVEFYFVWPVTFGQLALKSNSPKLHSHPVFQTEEERLDMLEYIKLNSNKFFMNLGQGIDMSRNSIEEYYFIELSDGYNTADQFIGDKAHYLVISSEVNVVP